MDRLEVQEQASDVAEPAESDAHLASKLERLSAPLAEKKEWMADLEGMAPTGQEGSVTTWEARDGAPYNGKALRRHGPIQTRMTDGFGTPFAGAGLFAARSSIKSARDGVKRALSGVSSLSSAD